MEVYQTINKKAYLQLKCSGKIGKALPSMCVLVIKPDNDGKPHRAKSRIVVLGNHEDRYWSKSQRYTPVLKYSSLHLLCSKAVEAKRVLQQGDCKNAFCHAKLPPEELTAVMPPVGNPEHGKGNYWLLNKTLYELRHSPHHWYNMFCAALKDIGLEQSVHVPCLFSGNLTSDTSPTSKSKLHVGIYVDNFLFYSEDPAAEKAFQQQLAKKVVVEFMGDVDYFFGHCIHLETLTWLPSLCPPQSICLYRIHCPSICSGPLQSYPAYDSLPLRLSHRFHPSS